MTWWLQWPYWYNHLRFLLTVQRQNYLEVHRHTRVLVIPCPATRRPHWPWKPSLRRAVGWLPLTWPLRLYSSLSATRSSAATAGKTHFESISCTAWHHVPIGIFCYGVGEMCTNYVHSTAMQVMKIQFRQAVPGNSRRIWRLHCFWCVVSSPKVTKPPFLLF